jgi:hypothetical protein
MATTLSLRRIRKLGSILRRGGNLRSVLCEERLHAREHLLGREERIDVTKTPQPQQLGSRLGVGRSTSASLPLPGGVGLHEVDERLDIAGRPPEAGIAAGSQMEEERRPASLELLGEAHSA